MKVIIIKSENTELTEIINDQVKNNNIDVKVITNLTQEALNSEDLVIYTTFEKVEPITTKAKILKIYPSLLPAFNTKNAIAEAYKQVKVTGVTISEIQENSETILAQYPVLIGLQTSYCDLVNEIITISKKLYPSVIEAVITDRVFDFNDLFKSSCHSGNTCGGHCSNCGKCPN